MNTIKQLLPGNRADLISILQVRFEKNPDRHRNINWINVLKRLNARPEKLWSLYKMNETDGEPDVIGFDKKTGEYIFCDCSPESPLGRRNICYDWEARENRKTFKPKMSAVEMASAMGIELLTEEEYRQLQMLGNFDTKTSSWIKTPSEIRRLGGALYADRRYDHVFLYHNGATSYYSSRAFRGSLHV